MVTERRWVQHTRMVNQRPGEEARTARLRRRGRSSPAGRRPSRGRRRSEQNELVRTAKGQVIAHPGPRARFRCAHHRRALRSENTAMPVVSGKGRAVGPVSRSAAQTWADHCRPAVQHRCAASSLSSGRLSPTQCCLDTLRPQVCALVVRQTCQAREAAY